MIKHLTALLLSAIICSNIYAQTNYSVKNQYKISGKILELSDGKAVPYATIQTYNNRNQIVTAVASDTSGCFSLYVKTAGKYLLKFYAMGYAQDSLDVNVAESITDIGTVNLQVVSVQLAGVTVSAKKLIMKDEFDRLVYDVTKDPEAKRVKMSDIMKKIPFMTTNADGKLKYLNNNVSVILIDGKPNEMISGGRQFPMHLIKGDVMSKIEIILPNTKDNPGEKPIVNIKLARNLPNGYATELTANGNTQNAIGGGVDFVTKLNNKIYISLTYGIDYQNKPRLENFTIKENLSDNAPVYLQDNESLSWGNILSHKLVIGATYKITKKDNVRLSLSSNKSLSNSYVNSSSESYDTGDVLTYYNNSKSTSKGMSVPKANLSFSYAHYMKNNSFLVFTYNLANSQNNSDYVLITNKSDSNNPNYQTSSDDNSTVDQFASLHLTKRYGSKHFFEARGSYTSREYSNSSYFEYWDYDSQNLETYSFRQDGLDYTQDVFSAFGKYCYMNKGLNISFILTAEQMANKGVFHSTENSKLNYNELNLFPAINIVYRTKHKYKIGFSYMTRTLRPNINYLNPFIDNSDPENVTMGNPNLKAEYAHRFDFSIIKNFGNSIFLSLGSTAEFTNNAIERVTTLDNQNISTTTYDNICNKEDYTTSAIISLKLLPWLNILNNGYVRHKEYVNTLTGMKNSATGFGYDGILNINLFKSTNISGSFNISPQINSAQTKEVKYNTSVYFYISQTLIKDKLFMSLSLTDPFSNHKFISNVIGNDTFIMTSKRENPGRVLGFRLRWNFGRLREKPSNLGDEYAPSDLVRPELTVK